MVPNGSLSGMGPRENTARTMKCQKVNGQRSPARPRDFGARIHRFAHKHTQHMMHITRLWLAGWHMLNRVPIKNTFSIIIEKWHKQDTATLVTSASFVVSIQKLKECLSRGPSLPPANLGTIEMPSGTNVVSSLLCILL